MISLRPRAKARHEAREAENLEREELLRELRNVHSEIIYLERQLIARPFRHLMAKGMEEECATLPLDQIRSVIVDTYKERDRFQARITEVAEQKRAMQLESARNALTEILSWPSRWDDLDGPRAERLFQLLDSCSNHQEVLRTLGGPEDARFLEVDPLEIHHQLRQALTRTEVRRRVQHDLLVTLFPISVQGPEDLQGFINASFEAALEHEVLVVLPGPLPFVGTLAKVASLAWGSTQRLYRMPVLALGHAAFEDVAEAVPSSNLSEAELETIGVLYGTDAYETLESARDAAAALTD